MCYLTHSLFVFYIFMLLTRPFDKLIGFAYLYLVFPLLIFAIGWLRWYIFRNNFVATGDGFFTKYLMRR